MPKEQGYEREVRQINVDMICPDPRSLNLKISLKELARAASKIKKCFGPPLLVCRAPACELYILLSDEVRFRAAIMLGLRSVPCEIREESIVSGAKISLSDPRFLFNSVDRLVETSKRAGIKAECSLSENDTTSEMIITVQKSSRR